MLQSLGVYETSGSQESDNKESENETDSDSAVFIDSNDTSEVISESGSSEAEIWAKGVGSVLDERGKLLIKKRRAFLQCKSPMTVLFKFAALVIEDGLPLDIMGYQRLQAKE